MRRLSASPRRRTRRRWVLQASVPIHLHGSHTMVVRGLCSCGQAWNKLDSSVCRSSQCLAACCLFEATTRRFMKGRIVSCPRVDEDTESVRKFGDPFDPKMLSRLFGGAGLSGSSLDDGHASLFIATLLQMALPPHSKVERVNRAASSVNFYILKCNSTLDWRARGAWTGRDLSAADSVESAPWQLTARTCTVLRVAQRLCKD